MLRFISDRKKIFMHITILNITVSSVILFIIASLSTGCGGILLLLSAKKTDRIQRMAASSGEAKAYELLDKHGGIDRLEGIVIGSFDDTKKMAEVDALIHGKGCIVSLEIKSWSGKIHVDSEADTWDIDAKNSTVIRRNPLKQAERHASIINGFYPGTRIVPVVLILGWNEFDGTIPENLITYKTAWKINSILNKIEEGDDIEKNNAVWDKIVTDEYDERSESRKANYLKMIRKKYHGPRPWIHAIIASACFIFIALTTLYSAYENGVFR